MVQRFRVQRFKGYGNSELYRTITRACPAPPSKSFYNVGERNREYCHTAT